jgi:hypothetical protein
MVIFKLKKWSRLLIQLYILLFNFKNKNYNKLSTSYLTYKVLDHRTMSHQCSDPIDKL